jgi:ubiquitin thioesterase protein OTUB1
MAGRSTMLNGYPHQAWQPPFDGVVHPSPMYRGLPMRADVPAPYHHQHTGHHGRTSTVRMAGNSYMPSDEEYAQLQKLSNEFEPDATVSF